MTIYSLVVLLSQFWSSQLFYIQSCFLTCIQVLRRQVRWSGIPISLWIFQFVVIHRVKCFSIDNEAEADVFLKFLCFLHDPMNVGNLTSGSSPFSKPSLYIWKLSVHRLLKLSSKGFEHCLASIWNEHNCTAVGTSLGIALIWGWNENWPFPVHGRCWVFQICWHIECSTLTASTFKMWNSSAGILSPPLALFVLTPPEAHLTSHFRMSVSRWATTPLQLSGSLRPCLYSSSLYPYHLFFFFFKL